MNLTRTILSAALAAALSASAAAQLAVTIDVTQPSCAGYTDGALLAVARGGSAPYAYAWSDGRGGAYRAGDPDGSYAVTVTDASGATASASATVLTPAALTLGVTPPNDVCTSAGGTYSLRAGGGTPPYTYALDGQPTSEQVVAPAAGYRYATVTDANGCTSGAGFQVVAPMDVTVITQNVVCHGGCDGTVTADVRGGVAPFTYSWNTGDQTPAVYGLDPGTYTVSVTDARGCVAQASGTLTEPDPVTFSVAIADACSGSTQATVTAQGGTGNLSIRWSTGATGSTTTLPEGQHYVYVRDDNGCEASDVVIVSDGIANIDVMTTDATCDAGGTALLCITGGRGPFTYLWSDGQTDILAVGLAPGTYSYTATDGAGCTVSGSVVINGPSPAECLCQADAGTLKGGRTTDPLCTPQVITVAFDQPPSVPAGFTLLYFLTADPNETIVQVNTDPQFVLTQAGAYAVRVLVYDPATLDLGFVVAGQTPIAELLLRITAGGGPVCADLSEAEPFVVPPCDQPCDAPAVPDLLADPVAGCDAATLTASFASAFAPPAGFGLVYLLTDEVSGVVIGLENAASFQAASPGRYRIHALVYDVSQYNPAAAISLGQTTASDLLGILRPGGFLCGVLRSASTEQIVEACPPQCTAPTLPVFTAAAVSSCDAATLTAAFDVAFTPPAGFEVVYVLTDAITGVVLEFGATATFDVTSPGAYQLHALVFESATFDPSSAITVGVTTAADLLAALASNGGTACGTLASASASTVAPCACSLGPVPAPMVDAGATCDTAIVEVDLGAYAPPAGYSVLYLLIGDAPDQLVLATNTLPTLRIGAAGDYGVYVLVFDPTAFDPSAAVTLGQTSLTDLQAFLFPAGPLCAGLAGSPVTVDECPLQQCEGSPGALAGEPLCFVGDPVTLVPSVVTPPDVPAPYALLHLLVALPDGTIIDAAASPDQFAVTAPGRYAIVPLLTNTDSVTVADLFTIGNTTLPGLQAQLTTCDVAGAPAMFDVMEFAPSLSGVGPLCVGTAATLNPGGSTALTYAWTPSGVLDDSSAASPLATLTETTTFSVTVGTTIGTQACSVVLDYVVPVETVAVDVVGSAANACGSSEVDLTATGTSGASFDWSDDADFSSIVAQGQEVTLTVAPTGQRYYVRATSSNGCSAVDSVDVVDDPLSLELTDGFACAGEADTLRAVVTSGTADAFALIDADGNLVATNADGAFAVSPASDAFYTVAASSADGCVDTVSALVEVRDVSVSLTTDRDTIYRGQTAILTATGSGAVTYDTSVPTFVDIDGDVATVQPEVGETTFSVTATDADGCTATAQVVVVVSDLCTCFIPTGFSPDGDDVNDRYYVDGVGFDGGYYIIYDRWGEEVFRSDVIGDAAAGWDGTYKGKQLEPDVYGVYAEVVCPDGRRDRKRTNVTLLR